MRGSRIVVTLVLMTLSACAGSSTYTVPPLTHDQRCVSEEDSLGRARENFMSFVQDQLAGYGDFFQTVDEAQSYLDGRATSSRTTGRRVGSTLESSSVG